MKNVELREEPTPEFSVSNIKMKRWEPKNWIEVDVEFDIKLPEDAGGRKGSYAGMKLNIYVALKHTTKEGKRSVAAGSLDLLEIPADQPCHALAYISPAAMKAIFLKDNVTASTDIEGWGVEFIAEGKVIAAKSSLGNKPWWENKEALSISEGMLLNKMQTPFANLFGDYDVPVKAK
ncbi:MAG: hypothetical protein B7Z47_03970 [Chthoniobacter sp. 12-60-6]|nr:MAG: hypothetical protein B7Z47_03970 [Chthoniobacter sp. 12-60-6]